MLLFTMSSTKMNKKPNDPYREPATVKMEASRPTELDQELEILKNGDPRAIAVMTYRRMLNLPLEFAKVVAEHDNGLLQSLTDLHTKWDNARAQLTTVLEDLRTTRGDVERYVTEVRGLRAVMETLQAAFEAGKVASEKALAGFQEAHRLTRNEWHKEITGLQVICWKAEYLCQEALKICAEAAKLAGLEVDLTEILARAEAAADKRVSSAIAEQRLLTESTDESKSEPPPDK